MLIHPSAWIIIFDYAGAAERRIAMPTVISSIAWAAAPPLSHKALLLRYTPAQAIYSINSSLNDLHTGVPKSLKEDKKDS